MHLSNGGRVEGFHLELVKKLLWRLSKIVAKSLDHQRPRERRSWILRHLKPIHVGAGQHAAVHAQHLRHFQGRAFEFAQRFVDVGGVFLVQFVARGFGVHQFLDVVFEVVTANFSPSFEKLRGTGNFWGGNTVLWFHILGYWVVRLVSWVVRLVSCVLLIKIESRPHEGLKGNPARTQYPRLTTQYSRLLVLIYEFGEVNDAIYQRLAH